jgi:DNA-binding XRE family transcriptional regulator
MIWSLRIGLTYHTDDHAVPIYKNSHSLSITFTVSKYLSETLGQFLKKLRLERGLEQRQLARIVRVHRNTVYEWENDRKGPSKKKLKTLAQFFKVSRESLSSLRPP